MNDITLTKEHIVANDVYTEHAIILISQSYKKVIKEYNAFLKLKKKAEVKQEKTVNSKRFKLKPHSVQKCQKKLFELEIRLINKQIKKITSKYPFLNLLSEQGSESKETNVALEPNISAIGEFNYSQDFHSWNQLTFLELVELFKKATKRSENDQMQQLSNLIVSKFPEKVQEFIDSIKNSDCNDNQDEVIFCLSNAINSKQKRFRIAPIKPTENNTKERLSPTDTLKKLLNIGDDNIKFSSFKKYKPLPKSKFKFPPFIAESEEEKNREKELSDFICHYLNQQSIGNQCIQA